MHALDKYGHTINQIVSRDPKHAQALASKFGAYYGSEISELYNDSDIIFITVNDDSYKALATEIKVPANTLVVHTAGPVPMNVLESVSNRYGVFYPLQSLNKERLKDFLEVPLLVEGSDYAVEKLLMELAESISNHVKAVNSEDRMRYHLAAVFANNFTNLMYVCAESYLEQEMLDFDMLKPLIYETALKLRDRKPSQLQTGPAKRHDLKVLEKHMAMMKDDEMKKVYEQLSNFIMTLY